MAGSFAVLRKAECFVCTCGSLRSELSYCLDEEDVIVVDRLAGRDIFGIFPQCHD